MAEAPGARRADRRTAAARRDGCRSSRRTRRRSRRDGRRRPAGSAVRASSRRRSRRGCSRCPPPARARRARCRCTRSATTHPSPRAPEGSHRRERSHRRGAGARDANRPSGRRGRGFDCGRTRTRCSRRSGSASRVLRHVDDRHPGAGRNRRLHPHGGDVEVRTRHGSGPRRRSGRGQRNDRGSDRCERDRAPCPTLSDLVKPHRIAERTPVPADVHWGNPLAPGGHSPCGAVAGAPSGEAAPISSSAGACACGWSSRAGSTTAATPAHRRDARRDDERVACSRSSWQHAPAAMLPARIVAVTCEPSDAPTERTSALKPVASPVCVRRHRLDDQVRHRREGEADAADITTLKQQRPQPALPCATREQQQPERGDEAAERERHLVPKRLPRIPGERAGDEHQRASPGSISSPAPVASSPKP